MGGRWATEREGKGESKGERKSEGKDCIGRRRIKQDPSQRAHPPNPHQHSREPRRPLSLNLPRNPGRARHPLSHPPPILQRPPCPPPVLLRRAARARPCRLDDPAARGGSARDEEGTEAGDGRGDGVEWVYGCLRERGGVSGEVEGGE
jgi:hypothetical protein